MKSFTLLIEILNFWNLFHIISACMKTNGINVRTNMSIELQRSYWCAKLLLSILNMFQCFFVCRPCCAVGQLLLSVVTGPISYDYAGRNVNHYPLPHDACILHKHISNPSPTYHSSSISCLQSSSQVFLTTMVSQKLVPLFSPLNSFLRVLRSW